MKTKFNPIDPFHLTDNEIDLLALESGTYSKDANEDTKQKWRDTYRKVEDETNSTIAKYGSVEKWYESGEGRIL
jgi:hypothetical protein